MTGLRSCIKFCKISSPVLPSVEGLRFGGWGILSGSAFCVRPPLWGWRLLLLASSYFVTPSVCLQRGFDLSFARGLDTSLLKPNQPEASLCTFGTSVFKSLRRIPLWPRLSLFYSRSFNLRLRSYPWYEQFKSRLGGYCCDQSWLLFSLGRFTFWPVLPSW